MIRDIIQWKPYSSKTPTAVYLAYLPGFPGEYIYLPGNPGKYRYRIFNSVGWFVNYIELGFDNDFKFKSVTKKQPKNNKTTVTFLYQHLY